MSKSKVLFIMTGSIACYKACHVISRLVQGGADVQVVATPSALQFVGNATIEGLTGKTVISDMYGSGNVMDHIHLMRWADLILVAPATANFINKAAQGLGEDLVGTLFLAHDFKKPFMLAPAMNTSMYLHPMTQSSIQKLKSLGIDILEAASGVLACGEEGYGKLLEPDLILKEVWDKLKTSGGAGIATAGATKPATSNLPVKVLVTAGGTQEAIDTVRVISNVSSGRTGVAIADYLDKMGVSVTLLRSHNGMASQSLKNQEVFTDFKSLDRHMKDLLSDKSFTHVIHAAAVSDYSVASIEIDGEKHKPFETPKLSSDADQMSIHLIRNPKIVSQLKSYSENKDLKVIAFKLTSKATADERQKAVTKLFENSHVDAVVHNDLTEIDIANRKHKFTLHTSQNKTICEGAEQLASELVQFMMKDLV
jgi:phosphopantothenoylcysteine decarboxylase/phosphopantothenate--cysteine ligase